MHICGIIAEFNPFHNGHKYIIDSVKARGDAVVCVIGDDFTQRGDTALITKYKRAMAALNCGADLCLLLPVPWSISGAENFALGGISILKNLCCVDRVAFGSECGDTKRLIRVARAAHSDTLSPLLQSHLANGKTFARARQSALYKLIGNDADILSNANDTLATEYINAAERLGFSAEFFAVTRRGGAHDSNTAKDNYLSASAIRSAVLSDDTESIKPYMPDKAYDILGEAIKNGEYSDISNIETAILSHLRRLSTEDIKALPDVNEGLENRIFKAARTAKTLDECYALIKTKRYTLARIRRIILSAYLGIESGTAKNAVPYIKVLGFNKTGEEILKNVNAAVPLILKGSDYQNLDGFAEKCFRLQNTAADLYSLSLNEKKPCGSEFTARLIKT